ncbi:MAG: tetraacyldisaccharide 4'-kinase [Gammaproteobacteria bacterium RIFCSPLOWO2_02_FULL_42_14]|nr:MAG: tetraacyldisaccharide 4'-kinase [Gammaproteobacteria bacterium RIFCSPHIGHO2_02_FULL_42_43]OGT52668.1 MAG: tetraacyldisaccharide 4'-kinase [Gammaproteobacteria bacterium RIFCSPHIGHO2_12_FULL_41_25]OGT62874.1 MAG: tetraacyldisaccharide 4'-kinase [Gammaproteobacteria bacterium RIFCSPLOWO2_02_FULL_42_14]OGT86956.1 MAG: tetraacyldisaccharide 4'-kinase [Gammaproteobacteria bacterium RIFCSPLOWO2_12_FULL_42_18]
MMMYINFWNKKTFLSIFLFPISLLYRSIFFIRQKLFQWAILKSYCVEAPVIIVGNITVGGTGKTPLVIAIAHELKENGWKPAIITRGYRGKNKNWPVLVMQDSDPVLFGDEAVLLAKKTGVSVIAGPDRVADARYAIAQSDCNVIISDDGLQHYRLQRDIEIAVIDGSVRFGNGFCLPAGPLRESVSRLKTVDFVVTNGKAEVGEYAMQFVIDTFYLLNNPEKIITVDALKNKKIIAMAAIGNPERFFDQLRDFGLQFSKRIFPDHYFFQAKDLMCASDEIIIMTEKDAVKCSKFKNEKIWVASGGVTVDSGLLERLQTSINRGYARGLLDTDTSGSE